MESGIYDCNYSDDLSMLMDYLGYDKEYIDLGFINHFEYRPDLSVIEHLNRYPLLEYNEDFNDFALTHVYSFTIDKALDSCQIYVTPKKYWIKEQALYPKKANNIISNFLTGLGLKETSKSSFSFNGTIKAPNILYELHHD